MGDEMDECTCFWSNELIMRRLLAFVSFGAFDVFALKLSFKWYYFYVLVEARARILHGHRMYWSWVLSNIYYTSDATRYYEASEWEDIWMMITNNIQSIYKQNIRHKVCYRATDSCKSVKPNRPESSFKTRCRTVHFLFCCALVVSCHY